MDYLGGIEFVLAEISIYISEGVPFSLRLIKSGALQAKLKIGAPGDKYEQEADRVAEQVMRRPEPNTNLQTVYRLFT
ncbi:MAG TPA: hypothetical protein VJJ51_11730 [Candidatus Methanoperedens sp.]|nr:hypothetical protein [Candidatus Methanoperedens sp.]HLB71704.1 hypothetical protein [Candidatus Methanoperedens sp.]